LDDPIALNHCHFEAPIDVVAQNVHEIASAGKPIGSDDLLIAAHAYTISATIVTANTAGFKRIRGLKVENWLA
jgi:tRNA(fMet)-specific endonuclease VapC